MLCLGFLPTGRRVSQRHYPKNNADTTSLKQKETQFVLQIQPVDKRKCNFKISDAHTTLRQTHLSVYGVTL